MKAIPKENMMTNLINIEKLEGKNTLEKNIPIRTSNHAIFLYDGLDSDRKKRVEELINYFSEDKIKISKLGCSAVVNSSFIEKKEMIFQALRQKIKSGEIASDTIIFMNFHTHCDDDCLSFSIGGIDKKIRIPAKELYQHVWSFFNDGEKPSFHNLGCNAGYHSKDLQHGDGLVINYAGESTIGSKETLSQAKEVLRYVAVSTKFDGSMPKPEKIWQYMESYATQEMSISGKGSYMVHQPMELPSSTINGYFNPIKGHKNPKVLIEYAFRHRPMEQVLKLIEIHDPKLNEMRALSKNSKKRILFHIIPNRVEWTNFNQHASRVSILEKFLNDNDSLQKFLFCHENGLLPKSIGEETADKFLMTCCKEGHAKLARHILEMPEFPVSSEGKETALMEAILLGNVDLVEILMKYVSSFFIKDQDSNTLFHFASRHSNSAMMELLLMPEVLVKFPGNNSTEQTNSRRLSLNFTNDNDQYPLELAIKKNSPETVKLLLEAGADPHSLNSKGNHFLRQAVYRGSAAIVKFLLEKGFEARERKGELSQLLQIAIQKSDREIALMLISHCAAAGNALEINTPFASGLTPLLLAVKKRDTKLITALLTAGADPKVISNSGQTVLHKISKYHLISRENLHSTTQKLNETSPEKFINEELDFSETEAIVKMLIQNGASVNESDDAGNTPVMIAAQANNIHLVNLFISQGANINAVNNQGHTLFHLALINNDRKLSKYLLENGLDLDANNFDLDSAISIAKNSNDILAIKYIISAIKKKKKHTV